MRVLLISANTDTISMPTLPLGLAAVAAATRHAGHEAALLNLMFEGDPKASIRNAIRDFSPQAIGISVRNVDDQNMAQPRFLLAPVREVVTDCRSLSDAPIVLGGAGYSIFPASALEYLNADVGIHGEGEVVFPQLLDRIDKGGVVSDLPVHRRFPDGLADGSLPRKQDSVVEARGDDSRATGMGTIREPPERSLESNLDNLPLPDPNLWIPPHPAKRKLWVPVQSRRGCPLDCSYCSTSLIEGRGIRSRSPSQVVRWLAKLREAGCRNFNFVDNTFNIPLDYAKELCREVSQAKLDVHLWCIVFPKWIDRELVELMRQAGCRQISFGFESGSDQMLRSLNKQYGQKDISLASKIFADAGIERTGFLLLGGPGETRASVEESLAFADALRLDSLKITTGLRIYPHTPLATTALSEGVIAAEDDLLFPRFYLQPELKEWLPERVADFAASRPFVM